MHRFRRAWLAPSICMLFALAVAVPVLAQNDADKKDAKPPAKKPDFPPVSKVTEGFTEVKVQDGQFQSAIFYSTHRGGRRIVCRFAVR